jgi:hypothetical protein|tara:strand:+ start:248 stop:622 length:375 start_codon:yes stop_codon:yes gene_type:complete
LFSIPSLSEVYVNRVKAAYETGCEYLGDIQPMEVWLTSNDETEAQALRNQWCTHRQGSDPGFLTRGCERAQIGVGLANYVFQSDLYYSGLNYDHHQPNLSAFSADNPDDLSAEYVTIHEVFSFS